MNTLLTAIDIFGHKAEFNIQGSISFKTKFGGVISLISCFCMIIFMIFFGDDFYHRKNPKIIESTIFNTEYPMTNLTTSQGIIAWKIEDHYTVIPHWENILYPKMMYESFVVNDTTKA